MKQILVIDDEFPLCELLKQIIEQENEGEFLVDYATQAREAVDKLLARNYDLALMDIKLSGQTTGNDILKKVKDSVRTKFLIYSALAKEAQWPLLVREGVDPMVLDYLEKSNDLSIDEFMALIKKLLIPSRESDL